MDSNSAQEGSPKRAEPRSRRLRIAAAAVCALLIAAAVAFYFVRPGVRPAQATLPPPAIPVSATTAVRQDLPIYLTGLGVVQASFTVSIHTQVDGKLQDVLFTEGQRVKKGDLLAKIDPRLFQAALDQAKAKKAQDEAQLIGLQKDLVRFTSLGAKGYDTQQNIDQQQAKVDTTKAAIQADAAAIETAETQLDYTNITAPSDGRMGVRLIDPGNTVHASDTAAIATLVRTQPTFITFTLPAQTLDDVRNAKARGDVQVIAFDRDNRKAISTGTLETIDNMIDQTTASYRLKATFANEDERLWPGQFVNARVLVDTRKNAVVIPNTAVQRGPKGLFAWVVKPDNKVEPRPIETGDTTGNITVVVSGLNDGEHVVTGGQYKLQNNSTVNVSANAPAGAP
ncbi:MAG: efflux RND transporter periplasmic adaptor subunit [Pseudomonadota bacterium]